MFIPSDLLKSYLKEPNRNMHGVRMALMGYINIDRGFTTTKFNDAINYVLSNGISKSELFEDFDEEFEFVENKARWTKDYYTDQLAYLQENFCIKRIEHVEKVGKYLYSKNLITSLIGESSQKKRTPSSVNRTRPKRTGRTPEGELKQTFIRTTKAVKEKTKTTIKTVGTTAKTVQAPAKEIGATVQKKIRELLR